MGTVVENLFSGSVHIFSFLVTLRKPLRVWRNNWNVKMGETRTGWHRKANKAELKFLLFLMDL